MHSYGAVLAYYAVLVLLALQSSWTQPGTTATGPMSTVLNVNTTSQATTGTIEEVLATYTLPANTLSANGKGIRITAWAAGSGGGNKTLRIRVGGLGGTQIAVTNTATGAGGYVVDALVFRTGAATQVALGRGSIHGSGAMNVTDTAPTQTLSGTVDVVITGTTAVIGELTFKGGLVEALN
jgi:hypothetical protein